VGRRADVRWGMRIVSAVVVATLVAALSGCGGAADNENAAPYDSGGSVSNSALPPSGRVFPTPTPSQKYQSGEVTISGRPEEGVEGNCLVMRSGETLYLLLGGNRQLLQSGRPVTVTGRPNPGLMTTCQQGTPFEVSDVQPA
jgi:hypothetical protein